MDKVFEIEGVFTKKSESDDSLVIEGYASTNQMDRDGDIIDPGAWTRTNGLNNFKNNPIILFNHNRNEPIGKALTMDVDSIGLKISAQIYKGAGKFYEIIKSGILSTFSVGFLVKDAEYSEENAGFLITDAELFEVSVVSIPANAGARFSISKSFNDDKDYHKFLDKFKAIEPQNSQQPAGGETPAGALAKNAQDVQEKENFMNNEEMENFALKLAEQIGKSTGEQLEQAAAKTKSEAVAAAAAAAQEKALAQAQEVRDQSIISAAVSGTGKLIEDLKSAAQESETKLMAEVERLSSIIAEKSDEMVKINESKRVFGNRDGNSKSFAEEFGKDIDDAYILGIATNKNWQDTKFGKNLMEKAANNWSGTEVSSDTYELTVSTNIERDIQLELVLAPLFREVTMNSASMIFPILPDAGYAEFSGTQLSTTGDVEPHGNLDNRATTNNPAVAGSGVDLTEKTITTKKLVSQSYLANETEEDAIMPVLPLIRESMIRSHARSIEQMILMGNHAEGVYGTAGASPDGLVSIADAAALQGNQGATGYLITDKATAADLLQSRVGLGKYGLNPTEVTYIVSMDAYYNLLQDPEFQDVNLVGTVATKIKGEVGSIYGSKVMICDEFAGHGAGKFFAVAVNTRNYFIPRLRGFTVESDNEVGKQRRVLVMSQRIGFSDVITSSATAPSVFGFQYKLAV